MDGVIEISRWMLPALLVFAASYITLRASHQSERRRQMFELRMRDRRALLPLRIQAHERALLFLERVSPEPLVMRLQKPNLTVQQLQTLMLRTVRQEWDHNVAQQLYISDETWQLVKNARENTVKLINTEAGKLKGNLPGINLSQKILEESVGSDLPTREAIRALKDDMARMF